MCRGVEPGRPNLGLSVPRLALRDRRQRAARAREVAAGAAPGETLTAARKDGKEKARCREAPGSRGAALRLSYPAEATWSPAPCRNRRSRCTRRTRGPL